MTEAQTRNSKYTITRADWDGDPSKNREHTIGGSDVGTILGLNPYKSAYTLWLEKTGQIETEDISDKEAVWWGNYDEQGVAERFCEKTGKRVRRTNQTWSIAEYPFFACHFDRLIVGEYAGLECKTTSSWNRTEFDKGDIPGSHYAQCQTYMLTYGADYWYYACKRDNTDFFIQRVDRDDDFIENIMIPACVKFMDCVNNMHAPDIDGSYSTKESIGKVYPAASATDTTIQLPETIDDYILRLNEIKATKSQLDEQQAELENKIKLELGENSVGYTNDWRVSWKPINKTGGVDTKALKSKYPDIYTEFKKPDTSYRMLKITKVKKED